MRFLSRPVRLVSRSLFSFSLAGLFGVVLPVMMLLVSMMVVVMMPQAAHAQEGPLDKSEPKGIAVDEIIKRFAAKEKLFREAREQYTYRQDVKVMTLDGDTIDGTYQYVFDVTFDDKGRKYKNVVFAPQTTLTRISMSQEDIDDIENRLPFVLTSDEVGEYDILYIGQQKQDELNTYVFDIGPKQMVKNRRYFSGRIYVDDHDFQIVKTWGRTVPDIHRGKNNENLFPQFTTWREQIDGEYWFPTYTRAEDTLHFSMQDVKIREIIKYANYRRFGSKSKITYDGQEVQKAEPDQKPAEPDQKPAEPAKPQ
jgi:hypothetical protein